MHVPVIFSSILRMYVSLMQNHKFNYSSFSRHNCREIDLASLHRLKEILHGKIGRREPLEFQDKMIRGLLSKFKFKFKLKRGRSLDYIYTLLTF